MISIKDIKKEWKETKEGIIIGMIVGGLVYSFQKTNSEILNLTMESQSIFDGVVPSLQGIELAKTKLMIGYILTFGLAGYLIDKFIFTKKK